MKDSHSAAAPTEIGEAGMEVDGPILVTGAAGRVGGVGARLWRPFANATCRSARWSVAKMNVPTRCEPSGRGRCRRPHPCRGCRACSGGLPAHLLRHERVGALSGGDRHRRRRARQRGDLEVFVNISQMTVRR